MRLTRRHLLAAAMAASAGLATVSGTGVAAAAAPAGGRTAPPTAYVVRAVPGHLAALVRELRHEGAGVGRQIPLVDAAVARLSAGAAGALRSNPLVASVTPDARVTLASTSTDYDPGNDTDSMFNIDKVIGAQALWKKGVTGKGIDVALIDSGVAPVAGAPTVVNGPDLTPESQNPQTASLDTYGHGTHMAGIIAGHDPGAGDLRKPRADADDFLGVAPDARIVSVKVADAHGATDVSQVIAGIAWVVQHAHDPAQSLNIRVLNLSFGTDSAQAYTLDPLAYAAEQAWKHGIVVVASAGNAGAGSGRMTDPAIDPYVIAVGADDSKSTKRAGDDTIPEFSSYGDGVRNPDLVAPGVHVQSLRVPGSYIDVTYGATGRLAGRFFRGSGTSQATAVVSGAAALLVQDRPSLTPDQVKGLLTTSAKELPGADTQAQGNGIVDVSRAASTRTSTAAQSWPSSTGTGSLDASRGSHRLVLGGTVLSGERDFLGAPFSSGDIAKKEASGTAWSAGDWNGKTWAGGTWSGTSWSSAAWTGTAWDGKSWAGKSWATGEWDGKSWADGSWAGKAWAGATWMSTAWDGKAWADGTWS